MVESRRVESGSSIRSSSSEPSLATSDSEALERSQRIPSMISPHPGSLGSNLDSTSSARQIGSGSICDERLDANDSITVVVRCRPLSEKEINENDESVVEMPGEGQIWVRKDGNSATKNETETKKFTYNVVFEPQATQLDVFEHSGVTKLLTMAVDGFSCTIFCYGQTGSGKTHSLTGPPHLFDNPSNIFSEDQGLIFRCFVFLFDYLKALEDREFTVKASFLEIYNEKVIDLLNLTTNKNKSLQVRWNKKKRGFFVDNLFSFECYELDDLCAVLEEGLRNRAEASHNMNEYSSRSHTMLTVEITSEQKEEGVVITKNGKINFVDLAGSEMTKKTNSEGKTLEEANNINKSLLVLGNCISSLSDPKKKDGHIPYRDSKLTKLLADSLSGSGVTLMVCCISPAATNTPETVNTLRYAQRVKNIKMKPIIKMDPKEKLILTLKQEVKELLEENQHLKMLLEVNDAPTPPGLSTTFISNMNSDRGLSPDTNQTSAIALAGTIGNSQALRRQLNEGRKESLKIDEKKLKSLDPQQLINLVKKYVNELDIVRKEKREMQLVSSALMKDQELVSKENERLSKRLEDLESGIYRSPIGSARSVAERMASIQNKRPKETNNNFAPPSANAPQVWVNPLNADATDKPHGSGILRHRKGVPESINKEIEKRRIGRSMTDLTSPGSSRGSSREGDPNSAGNSNKSRRPHGMRSKRPDTQPRSKSVPRAMKGPTEKKKSGTKDSERNQNNKKFQA